MHGPHGAPLWGANELPFLLSCGTRGWSLCMGDLVRYTLYGMFKSMSIRNSDVGSGGAPPPHTHTHTHNHIHIIGIHAV